jgi:hypothetical protein
MTTKEIVAAIVGVILVGTLAVAATVFALEGDGPSIEDRMQAIEERVEDLERAGGGFGPRSFGNLPPRLFDTPPGALDELRERLGGEGPIDEGRLRDLLERLGDELGGGEFRLPGGRPGFGFDPSFVDGLEERGILDRRQAAELRNAIEMLREALAQATRP